MPDSLADLEARRAAVQLQIAQLGDMRSGSITGTGAKRLRRRFLLRPVWPRPSARSLNASVSGSWGINC